MLVVVFPQADLREAERGIERGGGRIRIPDLQGQDRRLHLLPQRLTQRQHERTAKPLPPVSRADSEVHHIRLAQHGLAADVTGDGIAVHRAEPQAQRIIQFFLQNRFRPGI